MKKFAWICFGIVIAGCGSDASDVTPECAANEVVNPITNLCVRVQDTPNPGNNALADMGDVDSGSNSGSEDVGSDLGCVDDLDNDGHISIACGGTDCDDNRATVYVGAREVCDELDNNCDDVLNDGIDCSFYAHSEEMLYRIDPFTYTLQEIGPVPNLFDIDTHPNGTLYGVTSTRLHRFDGTNWIESPRELGLPGGDFANGMAIDNSGTAFITTEDSLSTIDLATGVATRVGSLGEVSSSGDCVVNKGDQLFMTSDHTTPDSFVTLDAATARSSQVGITSSDEIWALTAAWGRMFGLTNSGQLIRINEQTGTSEVLHTFPNLSFFGAASTPAR